METVETHNKQQLFFIPLPSGNIVQLISPKNIHIDLYHRNTILEKRLMSIFTDEPPHHYVFHDNEDMMIEA